MSISERENVEIFFSFAQNLVSGVGNYPEQLEQHLTFKIEQFWGSQNRPILGESKVKKKIELTYKLGET